jgi:hypothetical protein
MGISRGYVFEPHSNLPASSLTQSQVQHPGRQQWPRMFSWLQFTDDGLRQVNRNILIQRRQHNSMDESRALQSRKFRSAGASSNEGIGLLCAGDGDV